MVSSVSRLPIHSCVRYVDSWYRLPENVSLEEGALLEPLSVAIHATRRAEVVPGCRTLVLGAGAVGMLVASMLKVMGSSTIVIADIEPKRVEFAIQNKFADRGFVVPKTRSVSTEENLEIAKSLAESTGKTLDLDGRAIGEFDVVFECTGVETCLQAAIYVSLLMISILEAVY
jgi:L-iditol 2-dehydrogenase